MRVDRFGGDVCGTFGEAFIGFEGRSGKRGPPVRGRGFRPRVDRRGASTSKIGGQLGTRRAPRGQARLRLIAREAGMSAGRRSESPHFHNTMRAGWSDVMAGPSSPSQNRRSRERRPSVLTLSSPRACRTSRPSMYVFWAQRDPLRAVRAPHHLGALHAIRDLNEDSPSSSSVMLSLSSRS